MTSYEKCKAALGSYKVARKFEEKLILGNLHFTDYGRLDFRRYKPVRDISPGELARIPDFSCVIVFSDMSVPPIKCRFKRALECLNEVLAVSGCVWVLNDDRTKVIEFYYDGSITACDLR